MHVLVAGGNQCKKVYLGLMVEGKLRRRICGRNDEIFRPQTISLKRWQGKEAQLYGTSIGCFTLAIPNRYLPILQEGRIESLLKPFEKGGG